MMCAPRLNDPKLWDITRTVLAIRPRYPGRDDLRGDEIAEHLRGHVQADAGGLLDALRADLGGVERAIVALDGLREAQPQVPDPAWHRVNLDMLHSR